MEHSEVEWTETIDSIFFRVHARFIHQILHHVKIALHTGVVEGIQVRRLCCDLGIGTLFNQELDYIKVTF